MTNTIKQPTIEESIKHFTEVTGRPAPLPPSSHGMGLSEMRKTPIVELCDYDDAPWIVKIFLNYVRLQREETEHTATLFKVFGGKKYIISRASKVNSVPRPTIPERPFLARKSTAEFVYPISKEAVAKYFDDCKKRVMQVKKKRAKKPILKSKKSVIIYGEAGCGKTFNAEKLRKKYGMLRLVDGWVPHSGIFSRTLYLTSVAPSPSLKKKIRKSARIISFKVAMKPKKKKVKRLHHGQE